MTMFLSNREVRPTGYEAGEFIEPSTFTPPPDPRPFAAEADEDDADTSAHEGAR